MVGGGGALRGVPDRIHRDSSLASTIGCTLATTGADPAAGSQSRPPQDLPPGLYDHPLSASIHQALTGEPDGLHQLQPLDPAETPQRLARHLRQLNGIALAALPEAQRQQQQLTLVNQIVVTWTLKSGSGSTSRELPQDRGDKRACESWPMQSPGASEHARGHWIMQRAGERRAGASQTQMMSLVERLVTPCRMAISSSRLEPEVSSLPLLLRSQ